MIVRCKNTYGDGSVKYVEYEIVDPIPEYEDATDADYIAALAEFGVR